MPNAVAVSPIPEILQEIRNGRFVILLDDEDREDEADLVIPAQMCGPERVNFMATHGRGLVCLALESRQVRRLGLPPMTHHNVSRHQTAFTISIEAREGVSTGISANDRATTIAAAIHHNAAPDAVVSPGHIFPLEARDGGVLVRAGHTEAGVDLARLAGLNPAAVICEIMADDGTMARGETLAEYAKKHDIKVASIASLIAWRSRHDRILARVSETDFQSRFGDFRLLLYRNQISGMEHAALVAGRPDENRTTAVRVHALSLLDDILGDMRLTHGGGLEAALRRIQEIGEGVVVIIRERPGDLSESLRHRGAPQLELRDYGEGAQILLDLGVRKMKLLHNTRHSIVGLSGYGLTVEGHEELR
ncbi:MAG: 3,4-dihydroxy-2-butanone-4-phosphate synthase [Alphaproteobacteria bacterium]|nr:3,4-dihydroxy-2-butanone-4-phosphate synthase [Alphaproteobacteria bacterium]MDA8004631.1 3,4-dihydroxy-2-butanone-4-phosphate synthase [Alphaproteobacteria bacterium]MDA8006470.1 3,4-dihydroxy-2-butanone-4-phosphate synthase [Alphaproteobacteria bacterium]MDA8013878.1 3,4-dihydroxy-2-butanone-4-phosphate synthase [Alphaproteobacteria bacterium]